MRTLQDVSREFESLRFEFAKYSKEAKRRRIPVYECAGRDTLEKMEFELGELMKDADGLSASLYNRAVVLHNAIDSAISEASLED